MGDPKAASRADQRGGSVVERMVDQRAAAMAESLAEKKAQEWGNK
jgi:hypothetical protein